MSNVTRFLLKLLIIVILCKYALPVINNWLLLAAEQTTYRKTYIHSIVMDDEESVLEAQMSLDYFSALGDNKIVSGEGWRPVFIEQVELPEPLLGVTVPTAFACWIRLNKGLHGIVLRDILLHEYVHCYNIGHVEEPLAVRDLMFAYYGPGSSLESIKFWAQYIKKEFYE